MGEFVALWRLDVGYLVKKSRRHGAIENEIPIKKLNLFDGLPASKHRCWSRRWSRLVVKLLGVGPIRIRALQYRSSVHIILPIVRIVTLWGGSVRLVVVGIVMILGVDGIFVALRGVLGVVSFVVTV
jgi:hypothetical protein